MKTKEEIAQANKVCSELFLTDQYYIERYLIKAGKTINFAVTFCDTTCFIGTFDDCVQKCGVHGYINYCN